MSNSPAPGNAGIASSADYLNDVLDILWPEASAERNGAPDRSDRDRADVAVVPNRSQPRLVLPGSPRRAAAGALRRNGEDLTLGRAVRQRVLHLSMRTGIGQRLFAERVAVRTGRLGSRPSIEVHLEQVLGRPVLVGFHVGPPRNNRKPVLRVLTPTGDTLAFAKVGINPVTNRLVQAERSNLDLVGTSDLRLIAPPDVIDHSVWNGLDVLVLSPLSNVRRGQPSAELLANAMCELATVGGTSRQPLTQSGWWSGLVDSVKVTGAGLPPALAEAVKYVGVAAAGMTVQFGAWHGDWASWNMAATASSINLWDWERFETDVPLGFDALHFRLQDLKAAMPRDKAVHQVWAEAPQLLAPFGIASDLAQLVAVLYMLALAVRYAEDFRDLGGQTWGFSGSPMLDPLLRFVVGAYR